MALKRFSFTLAFAFLASSLWALIGTPCDPEKDFTNTYFVAHWKQLPHKNQEETQARCQQVNTILGKEAWKYDPTPNTPLYACLSYGASTMADWWAQELGWKLGTYRSYAHNRTETGFNPRKLELRYRKMSKSHPIQFAMTGFRKGDRDPITDEWVPIRPKGYARLLTNTDEETLTCPIDKTVFKYAANDYPMDGKWLAVVSKNWNKDKAEGALKKALRDYGPLYIQYEIPNKHFLFGTHAPVVIGYGTLPDGKTAFICHDSFGNHPKTYKQDGEGAAAYRYVSADEIDEAIVFPHRPFGKAFTMMGGVGVKFVNRGGKPIRIRRAFYLSLGGKAVPMDVSASDMAWAPKEALRAGKIVVYIEADYYMGTDGKGHWISLTVLNNPIAGLPSQM